MYCLNYKQDSLIKIHTVWVTNRTFNRTGRLTLFYMGGGHYGKTTKDCLPFPYGLRYAPQISWLCFFQCFTSLRNGVFKKKILWKISNVVKNIHRVDPSMQKSKFPKIIFFLENTIFSAWIWIVHKLSFFWGT